MSDVCEDPWCPCHEEDESTDLDDYDFVPDSTEDCPWEYTLPKEIEDQLAVEQYKDHSQQAWFQLWPNIRHREIDPAQAAADYYLLFGLTNSSFVDFEKVKLPSFEDLERAGLKLGKSPKEIRNRVKINKKIIKENPAFELSKISEKAEAKMRELVEDLDKSFREYVHAACGGELRHHKAFSGNFKAYRKGAWARWYFIYEQHGNDALEKMIELFYEFGDGGSYGGKRWAQAAEILLQRERGELGPDEFTNKQLFVDRVFTLEHNGGCFLNKLEWSNFREELDAPYCYSFYEMKDYVLNAHASNPVDIDSLYNHASEEVQDMVRKYLQLADKHGIEISGNWKHKTPKEKVVAKKPNYPKEVASVIDWTDVEKTMASVVNEKFEKDFFGVEEVNAEIKKIQEVNEIIKKIQETSLVMTVAKANEV